METVSLPFATVVMQILGLPGLIFIVWYFDHKSQMKQREQEKAEQVQLRESHSKEITAILAQYREEVSGIKQLYTNNADLVKRYDRALERMEKLTSEIISVVSLNTQTQTHLADAIKNNQFCPTVRNGGKP